MQDARSSKIRRSNPMQFCLRMHAWLRALRCPTFSSLAPLPRNVKQLRPTTGVEYMQLEWDSNDSRCSD
eukprot:6201466-Pleurochrysis_carterae.AAC.2